MKVAFYTLGCKVNQYETDSLARLFSQEGFTVVEHTDKADVYIVNSCTVTGHTDKKTRQMLSRFKRYNDNAVVALVGCFSEAFPEKAKELPFVDIIRGTKDKQAIIEDVKSRLSELKRFTTDEGTEELPHVEMVMQGEFKGDKTRAFLKIQDGCNRFCSYCIIPYARGRVRSKPIDEIVAEVTRLVEQGYKEVVLVGINLSSYGCDFTTEDTIGLVDVVEQVSDCGVMRIRLGSLEPELITDEALGRLSKVRAFCPQFHLSLQSGCDATLKRMNRGYSCEQYRDIVINIRKHFDNPSITTDIMVGFAGETEEEFEATKAFVKEIAFAKMHVFTYSIREKTKAATFPDQVSEQIKDKRAKEMALIDRELQRNFLDKQVGRSCTVLFENKSEGDFWFGYTKNYTLVCAESKTPINGQIYTVDLIEAADQHCVSLINLR